MMIVPVVVIRIQHSRFCLEDCAGLLYRLFCHGFITLSLVSTPLGFHSIGVGCFHLSILVAIIDFGAVSTLILNFLFGLVYGAFHVWVSI